MGAIGLIGRISGIALIGLIFGIFGILGIFGIPLGLFRNFQGILDLSSRQLAPELLDLI